jgi:UDP-N-acetyl-D-glucosamine dehydrogenase
MATRQGKGNHRKLLEAIRSKEITAGIIGLGYVGLPLAMEFVGAGFKTLGFDVDSKKIKMLKSGKSYMHHIPSAKVDRLVEAGLFDCTSDFARLKEADVICICVPTPLNKHREPDLSYVENTTRTIAKHLRKGQLVVLESTTYPGTTDELMLPILEESKLKVGKDFYVAYSPEREDPGNPKYSTRTIPKVVGGYTSTCNRLIKAFYGEVFEQVVPVSSTRAAEMTKLHENIFRCVNIAMVNELKVLCNKMGIDIFEVIEAAKTKPFGFMPFYPGPGLGGHCIPIDPFYLTWKAREYDRPTRFIELAGEINTSMPEYVVERTIEALADRGKIIKGAKVLVLGVAYKEDIDDVRESPALKVVQLLRERGIKVSYHDPYVPVYPAGRKGSLGISSKKLTPALVKSAEAVLILTAHKVIDYQWVVDNADLVIDTRNATKDTRRGAKKIVKA